MPPIENPRRASWGLTLSEKDFAALKGGCIIRDLDDKWAFVAMTDEELLDELSAEENATTEDKTTADQVPNTELKTDDELLDEYIELEEEEPSWVQEEWTEKAPPARAVTEKDMAVGGNISIRRAWTNIELYRLVLSVQPGEDVVSRKIEAIVWAEDLHLSEEEAKTDVILLCRSHLECDLAAAPDDDTMVFSALKPA